MRESNYAESAYKMTEKRLYRYAVLCRRIVENKREIEELSDMNLDALRRTSKSFVSLLRSGMRVDPIDAHEAQVAMLKSYIAADEHEVRQIRRALRFVRNDPYYMVVECRYFKAMTDENTAELLKCSLSTVRRNRTRLVRSIADALYGMSVPVEDFIA